MILIPGSLSFAKLVMMSSVLAKSAGDARYTSQDPLIQSMLLVVYNPDSNLHKECVFFLCQNTINLYSWLFSNLMFTLFMWCKLFF